MAYRLPFWKFQSIGNDFPVFHLSDVAEIVALIQAQRNEEQELNRVGEAAVNGEKILERLAIVASDRRFGVGGDGILVVGPEGGGVRLRMFNPDGTEDFCGNGLRCAAVHAHKMGWVGEEFAIHHLGQEVATKLGHSCVSTVIGVADYTPAAVPLAQGVGEVFRKDLFWGGGDEIRGSALTTGSTHSIVPVDTLPSDEELERLGPLIEHFELFPSRTSVIWTKVESRDMLRVRIWERGVGETLGCGTGSSAAAADYLRFEDRGGRVEVINPGGTVFVSMEAWNTPITVEGVAEGVYEGEFLFENF